MVTHQHTYMRNDAGETVKALAPVIVSASRATDIPAFYAGDFFEGLDKRYTIWTNPYSGKPSYVSYVQTRFIVFWSKNPEPLLSYLPRLQERGIGFYIQFTLNDYEQEGLEPRVPALVKRIDTFKRIVDEYGLGHAVWRFDPLILTVKIGSEELLNKIRNIGLQLRGYTERLHPQQRHRPLQHLSPRLPLLLRQHLPIAGPPKPRLNRIKKQVTMTQIPAHNTFDKILKGASGKGPGV